MTDNDKWISVRGARTHNLKEYRCKITKRQIRRYFWSIRLRKI